MTNFKKLEDEINFMKSFIQKRHPDKHFFVDITLWDDDDFKVTIVHSHDVNNDSTFPLERHEYQKRKNKEDILYERRIIEFENWCPNPPGGKIVEQRLFNKDNIEYNQETAKEQIQIQMFN